jgi:drug/metabolite transporter (DMT)-like permease
MWVIYYAALPHIQLSVAAAVLYTTPLVITLLSGMLGADSVTRRSWLVVAAGFLGVLLIVKPDASEFNGYQLLPLLSSFLYALAMVLTRVHLKDESTTVLTLWLNLGFVLVAAAVSLGFFLWPAETSSPNGFLTKQWQPLHFRGIVIMIALAMTFLMGNLLAAYAYQRGPAPTIAVYDYTYLVFATMFGVVVFTEYPDGLTVLGMLIITVSGIWAIRGNRKG